MIKYFTRLREGFSIGAQKGFARSINRLFDIMECLDGAPQSGITVKRVGDQWRIHYDGSQESGNEGGGTVHPKAFDIAAGATAGKIKLTLCYYQIGSDFFLGSDTAEITPAAGNLCAVINTNTGAVTAVMDATYSLSAPELFPIRLYVLSSTGSVVCDCRGSQVVIYG